DPTKADVGVNEITFSIVRGTGCSLILKKNISVKATPNLKFNAIPEVCRDTPINLKRYVNIYGGTFVGQGVKDTLLYPANMPIGENNVTYNYKENSTGCEYQVSQTVNIKAAMRPLVFNPIPNVCSGTSKIDLNKNVNLQGGVFSENDANVQNGFYVPNQSGLKTISYVVNENGCVQTEKQTFEIYETPNLTFGTVPLQNTKVEFDLNSCVNVLGGTFSGNGVVGSKFSPAVAGVGVHKVTYTVRSASNGCSATKEQNIEVSELIDFNGITAGSVPRICGNSEKFSLLKYVSPQNGTFTGNGIEMGQYFNPSGKVGINEVTYSVSIGGKTYEKKLYINVDNDNSVKCLGDTIKLCGQTANVKSMVLQSTFNYNGTADITLNGSFMPRGYSIQPLEIISFSGCSSFKNFIVNNISVEPVDFTATANVASEGGLIKFEPNKKLDGHNYKWTFGDGAWSSENKPSHYFYLPGFYNIELLVKNPSGCQISVLKEGWINVESLTPNKISSIKVGSRLYKVSSETKVNSDITVYPNPCTTYINIAIPQVLEGKKNEYRIYTSMGVLVKKGEIFTSSRIDITELRLGAYLLTVNNQKFKLIKNE
ncbi:PKD domain-containing protein, partial [Alistipes sp. ZOR0009]|uniref:PKD domain-containing protein n=1 Tax=Alistipes sp. ZOR0009 TaxID=1339253 RepID=UPI0006469A1E